jgi:cytochrome P450
MASLDSLQHSSAEYPAHVPPHLIRDYDFVRGSEVMMFPPGSLDRIRTETPTFYSPRYGGFWVFTEYEAIRDALQDDGLFKQNEGLPRVPFGRRFIPLRLDRPEHAEYRRVMAPIFFPKQVARHEIAIRAVARGQLQKLASRGSAELVEEFALALPAAMFCGFVGFSPQKFAVFHDLSHELIYAPQEALAREGMEAARIVRSRAQQRIDSIVGDLIDDRRKAAGDDAISILMQAQVWGRPLTSEEILNIVTLLFFAGTDSTAAMIAYAIAQLAQDPERKQELLQHLDDHSFMAAAAEELARINAFHHLSRDVTRDTTFHGIRLRVGDTIVLPLAAANRDSKRFAGPLETQYQRGNAKKHLTFGAGIHRCIGSHLAIAQLRIALEEVHRAIPDYQLEGAVDYVPGGPKIVPGGVRIRFTPRHLII